MKPLDSLCAFRLLKQVVNQSSSATSTQFSWMLVAMIFILFGLAEVRGQVWLQSAGSQYSQNSGAQCDTACPLVIRVGMYSNSYPVSPWSVTVSDGNNSVSVNALQLDGGNPLATIVTAGNTTPTINLSTLAAGSGTLTVTDPNNVTTTMPFNIVSCTGGSALLLQFGGHVRVAPNAAGNYLVQVINLGPNPSSATVLDVNGILPQSDCTITPVTLGLNVVNLGTSQKVTTPVASIPAGGQSTFNYQMQATANAVIGSFFTMNASFATIYPNTASRLIQVSASLDPNTKIGLLGTGAKHSVPANIVMPYTITFENDPSALDPAQIVSITDYLDTTRVEPTTFAFGPVYFGNQVVVPPGGQNPFSVTVPYDVDGNPLTTLDNIYVRISGSVDMNQFSGTYGKVEWTFESLDAPNGNPAPLGVGFLPPNITPPEGDGGVTFTVAQKANLAPGTLITNIASIVFDVNMPILTPVWTNRIAAPSTLEIARNNAGLVKVTWTGGTLEQSATVTGNNWSDAPVQVSPWTFDPAEPMKFFRVRND